jgi:hypothetical protein
MAFPHKASATTAGCEITLADAAGQHISRSEPPVDSFFQHRVDIRPSPDVKDTPAGVLTIRERRVEAPSHDAKETERMEPMSSPRPFVTSIVLLALAAGALADHDPSSISWKGWRVASSENLFAGEDKHGLYPLTYLFDGDPKTAWFFSGNFDERKWDKKVPEGFPWDGRVIITILPDNPIELDSIRIMNGCNESKEVYFENSRIGEVLITINGENYLGAKEDKEPFVMRAQLPDRMGWHTVAFERRKARVLTIEATVIRKGEMDDACISELELYSDGKKIDMAIPGVVRFSKGSECGCFSEYYIIRRDGTAIVADNCNEMGEGLSDDMAVWSQDRKRVAGIAFGKQTTTLWVVDSESGHVVFTKPLPAGPIAEIKWKDAETLEVHPQDKDKPVLTFNIAPKPEATTAKLSATTRPSAPGP